MAACVAATLVGIGWVSRLSASPPHLTGIALSMVLIGEGQGWTHSAVTAIGSAGVGKEDTGSAAAPVNVTHQLGGSPGRGVLVTDLAATPGRSTPTPGPVAHRLAVSLTVGTAMLALLLIAWFRNAATVATSRPISQRRELAQTCRRLA